MHKAQGGMEYLIIIAVILIIAGVLILIISTSTGDEKRSVLINNCRQTASECKAIRVTSPNDPCVQCNMSCRDPASGDELFTGAIDCCEKGLPDMVYDGSPGC